MHVLEDVRGCVTGGQVVAIALAVRSGNRTTPADEDEKQDFLVCLLEWEHKTTCDPVAAMLRKCAIDIATN